VSTAWETKSRLVDELVKGDIGEGRGAAADIREPWG
jgi:hypothetical protein